MITTREDRVMAIWISLLAAGICLMVVFLAVSRGCR